MKYSESLKYFLDRFLQFCYEFYKEDMDWDFMNAKFQYLVRIYLESLESKSLTRPLNFLGHGELKISKEESNLSCVPSPSLIF